ncbi:hypothetical protein NFI96_024480, partial [Prochilodus magdalenae]
IHGGRGWKILDCVEQVASIVEGPVVNPQVIGGSTWSWEGDSSCWNSRQRLLATHPNPCRQTARSSGQLVRALLWHCPNQLEPGFITLNALFIGLDVLFICKDSISLAKGQQEPQVLRAHPMQITSPGAQSWKHGQKISDGLCKGIWKYRKSRRILEQPFHP